MDYCLLAKMENYCEDFILIFPHKNPDLHMTTRNE